VEVFGRRAAEVFNVWHVARYIDAIAEAARAVYDVPLYVNVWLNENGFRDAGYDYPSGGAVSDIIPLWKAAAPHVDILAPDIYLPDSDSFRQICAAYSRADNPLLIPECGLRPATARQMFYVIAEHKAISIAPFGIDSLVDEDGVIVDTGVALVESFAATRAILIVDSTGPRDWAAARDRPGGGRRRAIHRAGGIQRAGAVRPILVWAPRANTRRDGDRARARLACSDRPQGILRHGRRLHRVPPSHHGRRSYPAGSSPARPDRPLAPGRGGALRRRPLGG